jgi:hypothetical protein
VSVIEAYVDELGGVLRGPRDVKADMLAEARDGLADASEAYQRSGLDEIGAQRRAIADFGAIHDIAADYQAQLGLSQGRRTGALICVVLLSQPLAWHLLLPLVGVHHTGSGPTYDVVYTIMRWAGGSAIAIGLLSVIALGAGTRYLGTRRSLTRGTAVFAFVVCAVFAVLGLLQTLLGAATSSVLGWSGLPTTMVVLGLPLVRVGAAARRCLAAA